METLFFVALAAAFAAAGAQGTTQTQRSSQGAVVCPSAPGKCRICNCIRLRIFDPCDPPPMEGFKGQMFGGCSPECQGCESCTTISWQSLVCRATKLLCVTDGHRGHTGAHGDSDVRGSAWG